MKKIAILSVIVLVFAGCFSPWDGAEGAFTVTTTSSGAENGGIAVPWNPVYDIDDDLTHEITLSGGPGPEQIIIVKGTQGVHFSVAPGNWTITVKAYDRNRTLIAEGSANVEIKPGRNAPVVIGMGPPPDTYDIVTIAAIPGVTVPATGETPVTTITETPQYTGTVSWEPDDAAFAAETVYTATITLEAKKGFTFEGIPADFFTVAEADTISNDADSGIVSAVFPITGGTAENPVTVTIATIHGVTVPATGRNPVTAIIETPQYTGTVTWEPGDAVFAAETAYTATITLEIKTGFTFEGIPADFFAVAGSYTVSNSANSGIVSVEFPATDARVNAQTPAITSQSEHATVTRDMSHSLSIRAEVSDGGTLSYQWYSNTSLSNTDGTAIDGATLDGYNPSTDTDGIYYYFAEVTNTIADNGDGGIKTAKVRSNAVTLIINNLINAQEPNITSQPVGATVIFGASHSLSVTANVTDGGTRSYQWYRNTSASTSGGTAIDGASSSSYNPPTDMDGTYYYYVEVTNTIANNGDGGNKTAKVTSNAVTLTVNAQVNVQTPEIISQPVGATVVFNAVHSLSVTATVSDGGALSYRWYSNSSASNSVGTAIDGATSSSYNPPTGTAGTYYYFVEITNTISNNGDGGNKTATVRSNAVTLTVNAQVNMQTPSITSQPMDATVTHNMSHSLSVAAASVSDGGTLSYQWYRNTSAINTGGIIIDGATDSTYNTPTDTVGIYYYFVEVTNAITDNGDGGIKRASIRSNAVTLTIDNLIHAQTPVITTQPVGATITLGTSPSHSLSVVANVDDGGTLSYQWYRNTTATNSDGTIIGGATASTYDAPADTAGTFYYFVEVSNEIEDDGKGGNKTARARSNPVTVIINVAANFDISYDQITDAAAGNIIVHEVISISGNNGRSKTVTLEVQGDFDSVEWHIPSINITKSGASYVIDSASAPFDKIGEYYLTLIVWKDGVPYSKTVIFTVVP